MPELLGEEEEEERVEKLRREAPVKEVSWACCAEMLVGPEAGSRGG